MPRFMLCCALMGAATLAAGDSARDAVQHGCAVFGDQWSVGIIAIGRDDWAVAANRDMAWGQAGR